MGYNNLIIIDTSFKACRCLIFYNDKIIYQDIEHILRGQDARLPILLQECLKEAGATLKDFSAIAVVNGPGSFTGIRVGMAYCIGLAMALDCPLITLSSLEITARLYNKTCTALMPIKHDAIVVQEFNGDTSQSDPIQIAPDTLQSGEPLVAMRLPAEYLIEKNKISKDLLTVIDWDHQTLIEMVDTRYQSLDHTNYDDTAVQPIYVRAADVTLKNTG